MLQTVFLAEYLDATAEEVNKGFELHLIAERRNFILIDELIKALALLGSL